MINTYLIKQKDRLLKIIAQELSEHKVALAISLGVVIGVVPFFLGLSIYLSLFAAWRFKLNHILIQFVSNIIYPLQLILFIPFLKLGTVIFSSHKSEFSVETILFIIKHNPVEALKTFGIYHIYGLLLWIAFSLILVPTLYFISKNIIKNLKLASNKNSYKVSGIQG